jgi:hypothetical protein
VTDSRSKILQAVFVPVMILVGCLDTRAADVPTPAQVLGFRPGDDFRLAPWSTVVDYCRKVDAASDRVVVQELGRTTEDRPYIVAIVSSPETIAGLPRYRELQHRVADPRLADGTSEAVRRSKPVVLITCSIHSNETASTLMATELLHELATSDDPATREILENTILLLVPSANPDGVEKVASWYEQTKGHPWEGEGMPWLYHKYAGHDTNRDWFMLNLAETRILTRLLYHDWFPTITYDVHQMGPRGARLFVPPFFDPINPNLDPRVSQGIFLIGAHMAADLAAAGKKGVLTNAMYDNWWNGGNRTTPQRHNMVGVLTEAASVKLASPIFVEHNDLAGPTRGFSSHRQAVNFVDPWQGGWWRLRDIVDYELIAARSVLTLAARYRTQFQSNYQAMARDSIERGKVEPPYAWIVPANQLDPGRAARMVSILRETGIEALRAHSPFRAEGIEYPAASWILLAAQPYRAHLKDMMEHQIYPPRFGADGSAEPPYDVAGWTLPLQMGVKAVAVAQPFQVDLERPGQLTQVAAISGSEKPAEYLFEARSDDSVLLVNGLLSKGLKPRLIGAKSLPPSAGGGLDGRIAVAASPQSRAILDELLPKTLLQVEARGEPIPLDRTLTETPLKARRIGVYQPWVPSMDEGWSRLVLEQFGFPYETLHNAEIRSGGLESRFDVILIPSIPARILRDGFAKGATAAPYVGGLGEEGAAALRQFVNAGKTIVGLEDASTYLIQELGLKVTNVLAGLPTSQFYGPGSILHVEVMPGDSITWEVPSSISVYFDRSLAFDVTGDAGTHKVLARYGKGNPLESGWLLGPQLLQGKAALVSVEVGRGRVVLFGFPPQHRGQTQGTFRLLFNALSR